MWLFTRYGFYSVVSALQPNLDDIDLDRVCIRARTRDHLENLFARFPSLGDRPIEETPKRDYRFRILLPKPLWVEIARSLAEEIQYDNFKDEASRLGDEVYDEALHEVWDIMYGIQPSGRS